MSRWREVKHKSKKPSHTNSPIEEILPSSPLYSRFKAFLTDSFLVSTPITYIVIYFIFDGGNDFATNRTLGWALILGLSAFIITFFWYVKKQTPGMKAYELKILNHKNERISYVQAIIRYVATLFAMISIFLCFVPFFRKDKKTFQDIISQTNIINEK